MHRSRGEGEHRPEEGRVQAAGGEHVRGAGPRESTGLRERAGVSKSTSPREHKHGQQRGRGRACRGRVAVREVKVHKRGCVEAVVWEGMGLREQEVSLMM